jgi:cellulose biosynthesis protein BcsQ
MMCIRLVEKADQMHTITFFATKGGSGRTVSTMALASGFLALGNRVMVMDCTDQAGTDAKGKPPSTLQNWQRQMAACRTVQRF